LRRNAAPRIAVTPVTPPPTTTLRVFIIDIDIFDAPFSMPLIATPLFAA